MSSVGPVPTRLQDRRLEGFLNNIKVCLDALSVPSGGDVPVGGTTDQILVKLSNTDYDTGWDDVEDLIAGAGNITINGDLTVNGAVSITGDTELTGELCLVLGGNTWKFEEIPTATNYARVHHTVPVLRTSDGYGNEPLMVTDLTTNTGGAVRPYIWEINETNQDDLPGDQSVFVRYNIDGSPSFTFYRDGDLSLGGDFSHSARLYIEKNQNPLSGGSNIVNTNNLNIVTANNNATSGVGTGIGFRVSGNQSELGAAIVHERTGSQSIGNLRFATKSVTGNNIPVRMTLDETSLHILNTSSSTSPSTGALIVDGGVGISDDTHIESRLNVGTEAFKDEIFGIQVKGSSTYASNVTDHVIGLLVEPEIQVNATFTEDVRGIESDLRVTGSGGMPSNKVTGYNTYVKLGANIGTSWNEVAAISGQVDVENIAFNVTGLYGIHLNGVGNRANPNITNSYTARFDEPVIGTNKGALWSNGDSRFSGDLFVSDSGDLGRNIIFDSITGLSSSIEFRENTAKQFSIYHDMTGDVLQIYSDLNIGIEVHGDGDVFVNSATDSISFATGALVVAGGIGVGGTSYFDATNSGALYGGAETAQFRGRVVFETTGSGEVSAIFKNNGLAAGVPLAVGGHSEGVVFGSYNSSGENIGVGLISFHCRSNNDDSIDIGPGATRTNPWSRSWGQDAGTAIGIDPDLDGTFPSDTILKVAQDGTSTAPHTGRIFDAGTWDGASWNPHVSIDSNGDFRSRGANYLGSQQGAAVGGYVVTIQGGSGDDEILQMRRNNALGGGFQFRAANGNVVMRFTDGAYNQKVVLWSDHSDDEFFIDVGATQSEATAALKIDSSRNIYLQGGNDSTSPITGTLIVEGGIGFNGEAYTSGGIHTSVSSAFQTSTFGNAPGNSNPFGKLPSNPNNELVDIGSSHSTSGTTKCSVNIFHQGGDGNDQPPDIYGLNVWSKNNAGSNSNCDAWGIFCGAQSNANSTAYGLRATANGAGTNIAAWLDGDTRVSGDLDLDGDIGFYGTAPQAKPTITGSRGGNAALASLLTQLATLGLITDSTTA